MTNQEVGKVHAEKMNIAGRKIEILPLVRCVLMNTIFYATIVCTSFIYAY